MRDRRELIRREVGGGTIRTRRPQRPVFDRDRVEDGHVVDRIGVTNGSAIEPGDGAVGQPDVASTIGRHRACRNCHVEGDPRRTVRIPLIDTVGPDEVVEFLELEGKRRAQLVRRCLGHQHRLAFERCGKLDDKSLPGVMGSTQEGERMRRIGQGAGIDDDSLRFGPSLRDGPARLDDRMSAEFVGPRTRCGDTTRHVVSCCRYRPGRLSRRRPHALGNRWRFHRCVDVRPVVERERIGARGRYLQASAVVPAPTNLGRRRVLAVAVRTLDRHRRDPTELVGRPHTRSIQMRRGVRPRVSFTRRSRASRR